MADSVLTFHSLGAGDRRGQPGEPGRLSTPPPRSIGVAFDKRGNPYMTEDEKAWTKKPEDFYEKDYVGFRANDPMTTLVEAVDMALDTYMMNLRIKYTGDDGTCVFDKMTPGQVQPIVRAYLSVKTAVRDLVDARADEAEIEAPFDAISIKYQGSDKSILRSASRASCCCAIFSLLLGTGSLLVAGLFHEWGSKEYKDATWGNWVNVANSANFWDASFWGWPETKVFRNIWCGLMLGVVFGFLDNFGLFYGCAALDGSFYSMGNKIASGLLADTSEGEEIRQNKSKANDKHTQEFALKAHKITEDMMSGLGNTFSGNTFSPASPCPRHTPGFYQQCLRLHSACHCVKWLTPRSVLVQTSWASPSAPPPLRSPRPGSALSPRGGPATWWPSSSAACSASSCPCSSSIPGTWPRTRTRGNTGSRCWPS